MRWRRIVTGVAAGLAAHLAYRRGELVVVALLAVSVLGGFGVDAWHRRAPALLDRLEAEPPRLAALTRAPGARAEARRERQPNPRARGPTPPSEPPPSPAHPVDLNGATADDLRRLPEIGPRLAGRILARRDELGGRFGSFAEFAATPGLGARRAARLRPLVRVPEEAAGRDPAVELAETPP